MNRPYAFSRAGARMMGGMPGGHGYAAKMFGGGARMFGGGPAAKMFGGNAKMFGGSKGAKMFGGKHGLMHGEHLIPHSHVVQALHNYKTIHNLHGKGADGMLPTYHVHKVLDHFVNGPGGDGDVRGGFWGFLAPALSAALPFISEGVKGLIGGFSRKSGERLAGGGNAHHLRAQLFGAGVPFPVNINGEKHWHVHGEGFRDLMKRAWGKVKSVFRSEPIKALGAAAAKHLRDAVMNAILQKVNEYGDKATSYAEQKWNDFHNGPAPAPDGNEAMESPQTMEDDTTGSGLRKRRKGPAKGGAKRARKQTDFDPSSLY